MKKVTSTTSQHLQKAANAIVKAFKTPAAFLSFLSWEIIHADSYELNYGKIPENESPVFDLTMWIEEVVQRWFKGEDQIPEGLQKMVNQYGQEGHQRLVSYLFMFYGSEFNKFGYPGNVKKANEETSKISLMRELGIYIGAREKEEKEEREIRNAKGGEEKIPAPAKLVKPKANKVAA